MSIGAPHDSPAIDGGAPLPFSMRRHRLVREAGVLLAGVVILAIVWFRLLSQDVSLHVSPDAVDLTYPLWQFAVHEVQSGRMPLWDPFSSGGRSNIGEGQEGVFYPPFLLFAKFGGAWVTSSRAIDVFCFLHALLGFAGAYWMARLLQLRPVPALACGLMFALGGMVSHEPNGTKSLYFGSNWTPFAIAGVLLAVRTGKLRYGLISSAAIMLGLVAGSVQPGMLAAVLLGLLAVYLSVWSIYAGQRAMGPVRAFQLLALVGVATAALSAFALLPILEYQHLALRWIGASDPIPSDASIPYKVMAGSNHLHLKYIPAAILHLPHEEGPGDSRFYLGVSGLILAALGVGWRGAPSRPFWAGAFILFCLLALGSVTPLLHLAALMPVLNKIREPYFYLLPAHLCASVLVGFGVAHLMESLKLSIGMRLLLAGCAGLIGWSLIVATSDVPHVHMILTYHVVLASFVIVMLLAPALPRRKQVFAGLAMVVLLSSELGIAWAGALWRISPVPKGGNPAILPAFQSEMVLGLQRFRQQHPGWYRVDFTDSGLPKNLGMVLRIPTVNGYRATMPQRFFQFRDAAGWFPPGIGPDLLGVKYIISDRDLSGVNEVERIGATKIYENPRALPYAWFVDRVIESKDDKTTLRMLSRSDFDDRHSAIIASDGSKAVPSTSSPGTASVQLKLYHPSHVGLSVESNAGGFLVCSDPYYPGWRALLDGKPVATYRTNYAFRGVWIPSGQHTLEFQYRPLSLTIGAVITIVTTIAIVLLLLFPRRSSRLETPIAGGQILALAETPSK